MLLWLTSKKVIVCFRKSIPTIKWNNEPVSEKITRVSHANNIQTHTQMANALIIMSVNAYIHIMIADFFSIETERNVGLLKWITNTAEAKISSGSFSACG